MEYRLDQVLDVIIDHRGKTAPKLGGQWEDEGIPVLSANNLRDGQFVEMDSVKHIKKELFNKWMPMQLQEGDVLLVSEGATFGQVLYLRKKIQAALGQRLFALRCNDSYLGRYLYYYLKSRIGQSELSSRTTGTSVSGIRQSELRKIKVPNIHKSVQKAISEILGSIDDKILLNWKMNKTLEAIVQALFKRWFIDFEFPNEQRKPYKPNGGEMTNSEIGELPTRWRNGKLGEVAKITMGQSPPGDTYNEIGKGLPFYQGVKDYGFRFPARRVFCTRPTRIAEDRDILLSVRAPIGRLNIANERCCIGRGVASIRHNENYQSFLYYLLVSTREDWNQFEAEGSVFGAVTKSDVDEFAITIPPLALQGEFNSLVEPIDERIRLNNEESHNLSDIRDALLPKLMSGNIRVPVEVR